MRVSLLRFEVTVSNAPRAIGTRKTYHFTLRDLQGLQRVSATNKQTKEGAIYQQPFRERFLTSFPSNSGFRGRGIESSQRSRLPQVAAQESERDRHGWGSKWVSSCAYGASQATKGR